jgi:hypothetical protein
MPGPLFGWKTVTARSPYYGAVCLLSRGSAVCSSLLVADVLLRCATLAAARVKLREQKQRQAETPSPQVRWERLPALPELEPNDSD